MHVAVYGGSFNPPHVAHQLVVAYVLATRPVDELWVMPAPSHAFGKNLAPFHHRVAMTALALRHFAGRARVSDLEEQLPQPARTLHTLRAMRERIPGVELSLVIGADILPETPRWTGWDEIRAMAHLVVLGREGWPATGTVILPDVSSTDIRERLASGGPVDHVLDREVAGYISRHGLYRPVSAA